MEFLVIAYDGKDSEAKQRRLRARPAHLEGVQAMKRAGTFINGGAILDDTGEMIGSTLYVDFVSREDLDRWLKSDPYVTDGVWVDIEVKPIRLALRE
ncbi:MAG: YciI family protein [Candidatus Binatia bacterium]